MIKALRKKLEKFFSMSKKEFKRAIGGLFKKGILDLKENGIRLNTTKWDKKLNK